MCLDRHLFVSNLSTCSYIYSSKHENYEELYTVATFLSPLHSNLLSEGEKKVAREYLKLEVKKLEDNEELAAAAAAANGNQREDEEYVDDEEDEVASWTNSTRAT